MARPISIIAMKGPPFTRKSELASLIAKSLKCPILSLDDILDVLHPKSFSIQSSTCVAAQPQDVAFEILCGMAKSQLLKQVSDHVVLDSPLSCQSHLDQLNKVAKTLTGLSPQSELVIVECKPKNIHSWQLRFETYIEDHPPYTRKWYKPKNWDAVMVVASQNNYDEGARGVSKLVLDPFLDFPNFIGMGPSEHPPLTEAIRYMITCNKGDGSVFVMYNEWQRSHYMMDRSHRTKSKMCRGSHCIRSYSDKGLEHGAICMACEKEVTDAAYTCKDCSLALHKNCAESFDTINTKFRPSEFQVFMMSACTSCKQNGKSVSAKCATCVFETHLKHRAMPTVIRHECDDHILSLVILPVKTEAYRCAACGTFDMTDFYSCKICNRTYHFECLVEAPRRLKHVHGGHHHQMLLSFSSEEGEDGYICNECLEWRDPQDWSYSCEECPHETHMYCVLERKERKPPSRARWLRMSDKPVVVNELGEGVVKRNTRSSAGEVGDIIRVPIDGHVIANKIKEATDSANKIKEAANSLLVKLSLQLMREPTPST